MKTNAKKMVKELKIELKQIIAIEDTWAIWLRLYDAQNNVDIVNLDNKNTYKSDL